MYRHLPLFIFLNSIEKLSGMQTFFDVKFKVQLGEKCLRYDGNIWSLSKNRKIGVRGKQNMYYLMNYRLYYDFDSVEPKTLAFPFI